MAGGRGAPPLLSAASHGARGRQDDNAHSSRPAVCEVSARGNNPPGACLATVAARDGPGPQRPGHLQALLGRPRWAGLGRRGHLVSGDPVTGRLRAQRSLTSRNWPGCSWGWRRWTAARRHCEAGPRARAAGAGPGRARAPAGDPATARRWLSPAASAPGTRPWAPWRPDSRPGTDKGLDAQLTHLRLRGDGSPGGAIAATSAVPRPPPAHDGSRRGAGRRPAGPATALGCSARHPRFLHHLADKWCWCHCRRRRRTGKGAQSGSMNSPRPVVGFSASPCGLLLVAVVASL